MMRQRHIRESSQSDWKQRQAQLDLTPMVDVTFLLLIFFMVVASFDLQKSIAMLPDPSDSPGIPVEQDETIRVEIEIDERGAFLVLTPDWQLETPGKQRLVAALEDANLGYPEAELLVRVDETARLRVLVDAMDAGTIAGFERIQVKPVDGF